jgi:hypothetical protein
LKCLQEQSNEEFGCFNPTADHLAASSGPRFQTAPFSPEEAMKSADSLISKTSDKYDNISLLKAIAKIHTEMTAAASDSSTANSLFMEVLTEASNIAIDRDKSRGSAVKTTRTESGEPIFAALARRKMSLQTVQPGATNGQA